MKILLELVNRTATQSLNDPLNFGIVKVGRFATSDLIDKRFARFNGTELCDDEPDELGSVGQFSLSPEVSVDRHLSTKSLT